MKGKSNLESLREIRGGMQKDTRTLLEGKLSIKGPTIEELDTTDLTQYAIGDLLALRKRLLRKKEVISDIIKEIDRIALAEAGQLSV